MADPLPNRLASAVLAGFGLTAREELASTRSAEELISVVRRSAEEGTLPTSTARLLLATLAFGDKRARDVLTSRPAMVAIGAEQSVAEVIGLVRASGRSRFRSPVATAWTRSSASSNWIRR